MKTLTIILTIAASIILAAMGYNWYANQQTVKVEEFREVHDHLNKRIDTLENLLNQLTNNVDTIKLDVKDLQLDIDSLKQGQRIIFDEVKKSNDKDFWSLFN